MEPQYRIKWINHSGVWEVSGLMKKEDAELTKKRFARFYCQVVVYKDSSFD